MECQVDRKAVTNRIFIEFGPVRVLRILVRKSVVDVDGHVSSNSRDVRHKKMRIVFAA
jgi:hypothetical protein